MIEVNNLLKQLKNPNFYENINEDVFFEVLGVESREEIDQQHYNDFIKLYKEASLQVHPDKNINMGDLFKVLVNLKDAMVEFCKPILKKKLNIKTLETLNLQALTTVLEVHKKHPITKLLLASLQSQAFIKGIYKDFEHLFLCSVIGHIQNKNITQLNSLLSYLSDCGQYKGPHDYQAPDEVTVISSTVRGFVNVEIKTEPNKICLYTIFYSLIKQNNAKYHTELNEILGNPLELCIVSDPKTYQDYVSYMNTTVEKVNDRVKKHLALAATPSLPANTNQEALKAIVGVRQDNLNISSQENMSLSDFEKRTEAAYSQLRDWGKKHNSKKVTEAVNELITTLKKHRVNYSNNIQGNPKPQQVIDTYNENIKKACQSSQPAKILSSYQNWQNIKRNLLIALTVVGVPALLAKAIHSAYRHGKITLFSRPNILDGVSSTLECLSHRHTM